MIRPSLLLPVEFLAGTTLDKAFTKACALATRLGICACTFRFNGADCVAYAAGHGYTERDNQPEMQWDAGGLRAYRHEEADGGFDQ